MQTPATPYLRVQSLLRHWFSGIRVYIALAAVIISVAVWWWGSTVFTSSQLQTIRIQEVYAWLSLGLLVLTLLIGPVLRVIPQMPGKQLIREARRATGLAAGWFALLHTLVTYIGQFQAANPLRLPRAYQWPLLYGVIALTILAVMAASSVDAVMRAWGVWWFRVHRLVYIAVLLVLLHAFMVGAHATSVAALVAIASLAGIWLLLNIYMLLRSPTANLLRVAGLCVGIIALALLLGFGYVQHTRQDSAITQAGEHIH